MAIEIKMPALSPTMTSGTLAKWLVAAGDKVASGDVIAAIETDKATMEVEAVDDGILAKVIVAAGSENVDVGTVIALLAEEGEDLADASAAPVSAVTVSAATVSAAPATNGPVNNPPPATPPPATPPAVIPATAPLATPKSRVFASPLARRIAADRGVAIERLTGSGPHGRILRRDVEQAATSQTPLATGQSAPIAGRDARGDSVLVANSQMRKVIAARLTESKQQAPHFYLTVDCMIDRLLDARRALNAKAPDGVKISVNDMIIRAAAMALIAVPDANASWEGDHTRRFRHADISMAVAVDGGLVTPVIWAAEQRGLAALAQTTAALAARARDGALQPEDYTGGSFTISNLGMFGIKEFAAVINPPQGGILAVGAGEQRPVVIDGKLDIATVMTVTLSADHRAVDGAVGAKWLQAFKGFVEDPVTMLL
jgi:pyruvate dehydrogenase E2 component (dihydrolipoamide acetyltransferase)